MKLFSSSLHNKKDLELCLDDLIGDGEEALNHTSDWHASINYGEINTVTWHLNYFMPWRENCTIT